MAYEMSKLKKVNWIVEIENINSGENEAKIFKTLNMSKAMGLPMFLSNKCHFKGSALGNVHVRTAN